MEINAHNHTDDPAIYSETHKVTFVENVNASIIQIVFSGWIEKINEWVKNNGFFVGHLKVFVESQENLWLSSTGGSINVKKTAGWSDLSTNMITAYVTAIIFGTTEEALKKVADTNLQKSFSQHL